MHHGTDMDGRGQLRRLARPVRDRVRGHQAARVRAAAADQADQPGASCTGPAAGDQDAYPLLAPALTRPIRWDLIAQQYDQMVKYATAIRTGTASTEAILRRFTRNAAHPTYQAMLEVGRAQKTVVPGPLPADPRDATGGQRRAQRDGVLERRQRHHPLRQARRYRLQPPRRAGTGDPVPAHPAGRHGLHQHPHDPGRPRRTGWAGILTDEDQRGLTPLFWSHVLPYGEVHLDLGKRLTLGEAALPAEPQPPEEGSTPA